MKSIIIVLIFVLNFNFTLSQDKSVYETSWLKDGIISGACLISAFGGAALNNTDSVKLSDIKLLDRNNLNFLDKPASFNNNIKLSNVSDVLVASAMISPILFIFDGNMRKEWQDISLMYIETMILAGTLPSFGKANDRIRPYAYTQVNGVVEGKTEQELLDPDTHRSFFSGHTTVAFASCVFVAKVYSDFYPNSKYKDYVWASSLLLASSVGYLRYASGFHFPTDILTGAIVGSTIGYLIPELHKIKGESSLNTNLGYNFIGVNFSYKF